MEHSLIPKQRYTFKAPFDNLHSDNFYIVEQNATMDSLIDDNVDVFNSVYVPNNVTFDTYNADFSNGVSILTLYDGTNRVIVPSKYISPRNEISKHNYTEYGLTFNLGGLTTEEIVTLSQIEADIIQLIKHMIGVTAVSKQVALMELPPKTELEHTTIQSARAVIKLTTDSIRVENAKLKVDNLKLKAIITDQSNVIINKVPIG